MYEKINQISQLIAETVSELQETVKLQTAFLKDFETIDHLPQVNSKEIYTVFDPKEESSGTGYTEIVKTIEELIPSHLKRINEAISEAKKTYVRVFPEVTTDGLKIGLYTRIIIIDQGRLRPSNFI